MVCYYLSSFFYGLLGNPHVSVENTSQAIKSTHVHGLVNSFNASHHVETSLSHEASQLSCFPGNSLSYANISTECTNTQSPHKDQSVFTEPGFHLNIVSDFSTHFNQKEDETQQKNIPNANEKSSSFRVAATTSNNSDGTNHIIVSTINQCESNTSCCYTVASSPPLAPLCPSTLAPPPLLPHSPTNVAQQRTPTSPPLHATSNSHSLAGVCGDATGSSTSAGGGLGILVRTPSSNIQSSASPLNILSSSAQLNNNVTLTNMNVQSVNSSNNDTSQHQNHFNLPLLNHTIPPPPSPLSAPNYAVTSDCHHHHLRSSSSISSSGSVVSIPSPQNNLLHTDNSANISTTITKTNGTSNDRISPTTINTTDTSSSFLNSNNTRLDQDNNFKNTTYYQYDTPSEIIIDDGAMVRNRRSDENEVITSNSHLNRDNQSEMNQNEVGAVNRPKRSANSFASSCSNNNNHNHRGDSAVDASSNVSVSSQQQQLSDLRIRGSSVASAAENPHWRCSYLNENADELSIDDTLSSIRYGEGKRNSFTCHSIQEDSNLSYLQDQDSYPDNNYNNIINETESGSSLKRMSSAYLFSNNFENGFANQISNKIQNNHHQNHNNVSSSVTLLSNKKNNQNAKIKSKNSSIENDHSTPNSTTKSNSAIHQNVFHFFNINHNNIKISSTNNYNNNKSNTNVNNNNSNKSRIRHSINDAPLLPTPSLVSLAPLRPPPPPPLPANFNSSTNGGDITPSNNFHAGTPTSRAPPPPPPVSPPRSSHAVSLPSQQAVAYLSPSTSGGMSNNSTNNVNQNIHILNHIGNLGQQSNNAAANLFFLNSNSASPHHPQTTTTSALPSSSPSLQQQLLAPLSTNTFTGDLPTSLLLSPPPIQYVSANHNNSVLSPSLKSTPPPAPSASLATNSGGTLNLRFFTEMTNPRAYCAPQLSLIEGSQPVSYPLGALWSAYIAPSLNTISLQLASPSASYKALSLPTPQRSNPNINNTLVNNNNNPDCSDMPAATPCSGDEENIDTCPRGNQLETLSPLLDSNSLLQPKNSSPPQSSATSPPVAPNCEFNLPSQAPPPLLEPSLVDGTVDEIPYVPLLSGILIYPTLQTRTQAIQVLEWTANSLLNSLIEQNEQEQLVDDPQVHHNSAEENVKPNDSASSTCHLDREEIMLRDSVAQFLLSHAHHLRQREQPAFSFVDSRPPYMRPPLAIQIKQLLASTSSPMPFSAFSTDYYLPPKEFTEQIDGALKKIEDSQFQVRNNSLNKPSRNDVLTTAENNDHQSQFKHLPVTGGSISAVSDAVNAQANSILMGGDATPNLIMQSMSPPTSPMTTALSSTRSEQQVLSATLDHLRTLNDRHACLSKHPTPSVLQLLCYPYVPIEDAPVPNIRVEIKKQNAPTEEEIENMKQILLSTGLVKDDELLFWDSLFKPRIISANHSANSKNINEDHDDLDIEDITSPQHKSKCNASPVAPPISVSGFQVTGDARWLLSASSLLHSGSWFSVLWSPLTPRASTALPPAASSMLTFHRLDLVCKTVQASASRAAKNFSVAKHNAVNLAQQLVVLTSAINMSILNGMAETAINQLRTLLEENVMLMMQSATESSLLRFGVVPSKAVGECWDIIQETEIPVCMMKHTIGYCDGEVDENGICTTHIKVSGVVDVTHQLKDCRPLFNSTANNLDTWFKKCAKWVLPDFGHHLKKLVRDSFDNNSNNPQNGNYFQNHSQNNHNKHQRDSNNHITNNNNRNHRSHNNNRKQSNSGQGNYNQHSNNSRNVQNTNVNRSLNNNNTHQRVSSNNSMNARQNRPNNQIFGNY